MEKVILIFGAGANIGRAIASKFADNGYKVALAARSLSTGISNDGSLNIKADFSDPQAVLEVFERTKQELGPPNIVVYNGKKRQSVKPLLSICIA